MRICNVIDSIHSIKKPIRTNKYLIVILHKQLFMISLTTIRYITIFPACVRWRCITPGPLLVIPCVPAVVVVHAQFSPFVFLRSLAIPPLTCESTFCYWHSPEVVMTLQICNTLLYDYSTYIAQNTKWYILYVNNHLLRKKGSGKGP